MYLQKLIQINVYRIAIETVCFRATIMFDYIILARQTAKDQSHHFHIIGYLEIV